MFEPIREDKVWGSVIHAFASPHASVSCLEVNKGFRCSTHRHLDRANQFILLSGCVVIEQWIDGLDKRPHRSILIPGSILTVPSWLYHRFRVWQSGQIIEVYWPDHGGSVRPEDIDRNDTGGPDDLDELEHIIKEWG